MGQHLVTHDPCDPSDFRDPFDPFPALLAAIHLCIGPWGGLVHTCSCRFVTWKLRQGTWRKSATGCLLTFLSSKLHRRTKALQQSRAKIGLGPAQPLLIHIQLKKVSRHPVADFLQVPWRSFQVTKLQMQVWTNPPNGLCTNVSRTLLSHVCAVAQYVVLEGNANVNGIGEISHRYPSKTLGPIWVLICKILLKSIQLLPLCACVKKGVGRGFFNGLHGSASCCKSQIL